jgi:hypothetical protein
MKKNSRIKREFFYAAKKATPTGIASISYQARD